MLVPVYLCARDVAADLSLKTESIMQNCLCSMIALVCNIPDAAVHYGAVTSCEGSHSYVCPRCGVIWLRLFKAEAKTVDSFLTRHACHVQFYLPCVIRGAGLSFLRPRHGCSPRQCRNMQQLNVKEGSLLSSAP
jgi:hypothetical protein